MKTVIKLLLAAAVLHAVARSAISAKTYYDLKDASQQLLVFGDDATPSELQQGIVARAAELSVPLEADNVSVRREGPRTIADASYVDRVEFLPGYRYPVNYSFHVQAISTR